MGDVQTRWFIDESEDGTRKNTLVFADNGDGANVILKTKTDDVFGPQVSASLGMWMTGPALRSAAKSLSELADKYDSYVTTIMPRQALLSLLADLEAIGTPNIVTNSDSYDALNALRKVLEEED